MRHGTIKSVGLAAGLSAIALTCSGSRADAFLFGPGGLFDPAPQPAAKASPPRNSARQRLRALRKDAPKAEKAAPALTIPPGPLHVIVSIDKQQATLFANGVAVAHSAISSGTPSHPTPMGVFSIIQKRRHHVSNLYFASMPYMQRITWSGSALHQGPLPGYPASHGCVRLTTEFAGLLWKATKIGARVIIAKPEVAPVEIEHPRLFTARVNVASDDAGAARPKTILIKTADVTGTVPATLASEAASTAPVQDAPVKDAQVQDAPVLSAPQSTPPQDGAPSSVTKAADGTKDRRNTKPVSVFVSRKEAKLYVRRAMEPVFDVPVTIAQPDQPIGTHVYTAMEAKAAGSTMRWTVVTIPSTYPRHAEPKRKTGKLQRPNRRADTEPPKYEPVPSASDALTRLTIPQQTIDQITEMMVPGSSLIISDNRLSDETGKYTDFIVLTR